MQELQQPSNLIKINCYTFKNTFKLKLSKKIIEIYNDW